MPIEEKIPFVGRHGLYVSWYRATLRTPQSDETRDDFDWLSSEQPIGARLLFSSVSNSTIQIFLFFFRSSSSSSSRKREKDLKHAK